VHNPEAINIWQRCCYILYQQCHYKRGRENPDAINIWQRCCYILYQQCHYKRGRENPDAINIWQRCCYIPLLTMIQTRNSCSAA
jgi:hypothetical protein